MIITIKQDRSFTSNRITAILLDFFQFILLRAFLDKNRNEKELVLMELIKTASFFKKEEMPPTGTLSTAPYHSQVKELCQC